MNRSRLNMTTSHVTRSLFTLPVPNELIYPGQVGLVSGGSVVTVSLIGSTIYINHRLFPCRGSDSRGGPLATLITAQLNRVSFKPPPPLLQTSIKINKLASGYVINYYQRIITVESSEIFKICPITVFGKGQQGLKSFISKALLSGPSLVRY